MKPTNTPITTAPILWRRSSVSSSRSLPAKCLKNRALARVTTPVKRIAPASTAIRSESKFAPVVRSTAASA
jgi:hypothetical protein